MDKLDCSDIRGGVAESEAWLGEGLSSGIVVALCNVDSLIAIPRLIEVAMTIKISNEKYRITSIGDTVSNLWKKKFT